MTLDFTNFNNIVAITNYFTTNEICKDFLAEQRWGDDVVCPYCGAHHCYKCEDGRFLCPNMKCHRKFNSTVGTIFAGSHVSLVKWFFAIYLISSHKRGITSCQLARDIKVQQRTAWFMLHKMRMCLHKNNVDSIFNGAEEVEIDEAYIGGINKWRHDEKKLVGGQGGANQTPIFGMVERKNGMVVAVKVDNTQRDELFPIIKKHVSDLKTIVYTDESTIYDSLTKNCGFPHFACNHADGKYYTECGASTNCVEGFWSHFKRMIRGVYFKVSVDYLQRYIDEECFRWNTRKVSEGKRFELFFGACIGRISYKDVTAMVA